MGSLLQRRLGKVIFARLFHKKRSGKAKCSTYLAPKGGCFRMDGHRTPKLNRHRQQENTRDRGAQTRSVLHRKKTGGHPRGRQTVSRRGCDPRRMLGEPHRHERKSRRRTGARLRPPSFKAGIVSLVIRRTFGDTSATPTRLAWCDTARGGAVLVKRRDPSGTPAGTAGSCAATDHVADGRGKGTAGGRGWVANARVRARKRERSAVAFVCVTFVHSERCHDTTRHSRSPAAGRFVFTTASQLRRARSSRLGRSGSGGAYHMLCFWVSLVVFCLLFLGSWCTCVFCEFPLLA